MEDLQNQHNGEPTPRRRRAVRSVPMGTERAQQSSVSASAHQAVPSASEIPTADNAAVPDGAVNEIPTVPDRETASAVSAEAVQAKEYVTDAVAAAVLDEDLTAGVAMPDPAAESVSETEARETVGGTQKSFEDTDSFAAVKTFSAEKAPAVRSVRNVWAAVCVAAVLLIACMAAMLPLVQRTEAVMLYVDETAVGYIASEQDVREGLTSVLDDLRDSTSQPFDAQLQYRCETTAVQGSIDLLSADAIYDAMYAQATEGYVRAYRLIGTESEAVPMSTSENGIIMMNGVMTEAEILSAIEAASAICREQYAAGLPSGTHITAEPAFTWETAWVAEGAILDEGALVSMIVNAQKTESAMLNITAMLTETAAERIPYETTYVPNDENYDGIRSMISAGADGLAQISYTVLLDPLTGAVLSRTESARTVVREPVNAIAYEGRYPLPDGVSTGTFSWPLPELPDDDLPLDENGNPYMPENPLALKNTYVSSGYGWRDLWGADDFHLGLDIVAPAYTEIYAADGGVVVFAAYSSSYGYMTRIRHANNVETVYAHQIKQTVKAGDVVEKGQLIGYVGSTGTSSGSHLHLEFRRDHVTVDPAEYITVPEDVLVLGEGY